MKELLSKISEWADRTEKNPWWPYGYMDIWYEVEAKKADKEAGQLLSEIYKAEKEGRITERECELLNEYLTAELYRLVNFNKAKALGLGLLIKVREAEEMAG